MSTLTTLAVEWRPIAVWVSALATFLAVLVAALVALGYFDGLRGPRIHVTFWGYSPGAGAVTTAAKEWTSSPPLVLERSGRVGGAVESVELGDVLLCQLEVEELRVFCDPVSVGRLGDQRDATLNAPAEQHLSGCASEALCDA
jgi:hypothetical protein